MLQKKIKILDSTSYLVDAKKLFDLVSIILNTDLHAFDDLRDIEQIYEKGLNK